MFQESFCLSFCLSKYGCHGDVKSRGQRHVISNSFQIKQSKEPEASGGTHKDLSSILYTHMTYNIENLLTRFIFRPGGRILPEANLDVNNFLILKQTLRNLVTFSLKP